MNPADVAIPTHQPPSRYASGVEDLPVSAQVLRSRIQELEYDLGGSLLNRACSRRPMTLTPLGQAVLDAHQTMQEEMKHLVRQPDGETVVRQSNAAGHLIG